jgi:hypothetical protein
MVNVGGMGCEGQAAHTIDIHPSVCHRGLSLLKAKNIKMPAKYKHCTVVRPYQCNVLIHRISTCYFSLYVDGQCAVVEEYTWKNTQMVLTYLS